MPVRRLALSSFALSLCALAPAAAAQTPGLARFEAAVATLHAYALTIDAHEVLGDRSQDYQFRYEFDGRRETLHVLQGPGAGSTLRGSGDGRVVASRDGVPFLHANGRSSDERFTTMRGNGLGAAGLAALARCFAAHAADVTEFAGPRIDGRSTTALVLARPACPGDPPGDRNVTSDVLDISASTGLPVLRRRYEGRDVVERWYVHDIRRF